MRAIVYDKYGSPDNLGLRDVDKPVPKRKEVLVHVRAAGLNPADWHFLRGLPYIARLIKGIPGPGTTIIGSDISGTVEVTGEYVTRFEPGDDVFGEVGFGGCAEYIAVPEKKLERKPTKISHEQAATLPMAAMTALIGIRDKGGAKPGMKVLINGASGGVGTFAVQIAKALGAEVTGVCSTKNVAMVRSIGADHIIDYTQEDFTKSDQRFDLMLDNVGNRPIRECRRVLAPKAVYGAPGGGSGRWIGPLAHQLRAMFTSLFVSQKLVPVNDKPNLDLRTLRELTEGGQLSPVIDRMFTLEDTPAAIRYLEDGHVSGKIVIVVGG